MMNTHSRKRIYCAVVTLLFMSLVAEAWAGDEWQSIFQGLSEDGQITPGMRQQAALYQAEADFTVTDLNHYINDFNDNDTVKLKIEGNGVELSFNGNKEALVEWADANRADLLKAIFGNAPDSAIAGMTDSQALTQNLFSSVYASPMPERSSFVPVSNRDIAIKAQYDFMEINDIDATGTSGMLHYNRYYGEDRDKGYGITIPYRYLDVDDQLSTQYQHVSFVPYFKKRWYQDQSVVEWAIHGLLGLTYLTSDAFEEGGGYYDYGAGTGVKYAYALNDSLSLSAGMVLQAMKRELGSNFVSDEMQWLTDSLNDMPTVIDLTPAAGVFWCIVPDRLSFRGELFRIHQLQSDVITGENQTVLISAFNFNFKKVQLELGYKQSFELEDVTDQSLIASFKFSW